MSGATATASRGWSFDPARAAYRALTSVRFAVALISTLALFGLLGVLIPQVPEAMRGNDAAVSAWVETQRGTFGPLTTPMERLGLFEVFQAKWFLFALGYLVLNVTTCTYNRWSPTFRNVFHPPRRVPEAFFDRAHSRASFAAVEPARAEEALRGLRFRVRTDVEAGATYIFADRYPWVQLSTFVSHLALILFIAGGLVTSLTGFTADVFAGEGTTTPVFAVSDPRQLQIRVEDAVGVYGEQGNALDFRTRLTIFRNGEEVAAGYSTVNNPLKYGGYRFHQVAYFPDGAALRIRETATGNTVFHETFPLQDSTAAPAVTISDSSGRELLRDIIAPTDFLAFASGTLVAVEGGRVIWVGVTQDNAGAWQAVAFDPAAGDVGKQIRMTIGETAELSGLRVRFDRVVSLPAAVGIGVPGGDSDVLAQMTEDAGGEPALMLVGEGRPALSLAQDEPVTVGDYEYTFEGRREFSGISVKRDRGAWFIWVATGMLVGGLALTFYVPRRRLWMKLTRERTYVAALAEKSGGFKKEMRVLAERMGVEPPPEMEEEP